MKKIIVIVLVVAAIWLVVANPFKSETESKKEVIKIGATLPLTGDVAHIGTMVKKAMELAVKDAGETKFDYELIFEDDQQKQIQANLNTVKLFNIDKVDAIISMWDMYSIVSPKAEMAKKIHFACTFGSNAAKGEYNFNSYTQTGEHFETLYNHMKKEGIKNIAFIHGKYSGSFEQVDELERLFAKTDIDVVVRETYNPGLKDFRMLINKLESLKTIDLYYIIGVPPEPFLFVKQYRELTGKNNVTSIDAFYEAEDRNIFNDMWYVESSFGTEEFIEKFNRDTGHETQPCTANIYDAVSLLIYGYERVGVDGMKPDNKLVVKAIKEKDKYDGALGEFTVDGDGLIHSKAYLKKVINGKSVSLSF